MKLVFQDLLGSKSLPYVRKVLKACGQVKPPICHRTVTEYLRLKLSDELPADFPTAPKLQNPELHETLSTCCARLNRERREVWFYKHMPRQRTGRSICGIRSLRCACRECAMSVSTKKCRWRRTTDYRLRFTTTATSCAVCCTG